MVAKTCSNTAQQKHGPYSTSSYLEITIYLSDVGISTPTHTNTEHCHFIINQFWLDFKILIECRFMGFPEPSQVWENTALKSLSSFILGLIKRETCLIIGWGFSSGKTLRPFWGPGSTAVYIIAYPRQWDTYSLLKWVFLQAKCKGCSFKLWQPETQLSSSLGS